MKKFKENLAEIFEVDSVSMSDKLIDFDLWDSMTILSIIALCSEEYQVHIANDDFDTLDTIQSLYDLIEERRI